MFRTSKTHLPRPRRQNRWTGFTLVEVMVVIIILGIIGLGAMIYVANTRPSSITSTKIRNTQMLNQLTTIAHAAGATIGAGASNNIDTTSATTAITSLNTGFTVSSIPIQMKPPVATPGSYTLTGTPPNITFGYNAATTALP